MVRYNICETPHYKGLWNYKVLDTADSMKDALRKARPLAIKKGMVDIYTSAGSRGCAIGIDGRTAYFYQITKNREVLSRILSDGSLSSNTTEAGRKEAIHMLNHWM